MATDLLGVEGLIQLC